MEWHIEGYTAFSPDFNDYEGRGCIIYTKVTLQAYHIDVQGYHQIEQVTIGVCCANNMKLFLTCIYRSPSRNSNECLAEMNRILSLKKVSNINYDLRLIVGDFNMKEIDWETNTNEEHISTKFLEVVSDTFLTQHVSKPTRYREQDSPSMLDLILTNEDGMIDSIEHNAPLGKSDHEVLEFSIKCGNRQQTYNKKSRKYFKGNYVEINKSLSATNWNTALSMGSVDDMWNSLADKLQRLSQEHIPESRPSKRKFNTPWMDNETLDAVKKKRKRWKKYKYCRSPYNKEKYDEEKKSRHNGKERQKKIREASSLRNEN